jgi:hypothetical protein
MSVPDSRRRGADRPHAIVVESTVVRGTTGKFVAPEPTTEPRAGDGFDDGNVVARASVAWSAMSVNGGFF